DPIAQQHVDRLRARRIRPDEPPTRQHHLVHARLPPHPLPISRNRATPLKEPVWRMSSEVARDAPPRPQLLEMGCSTPRDGTAEGVYAGAVDSTALTRQPPRPARGASRRRATAARTDPRPRARR